tara:strand:+ start:254 stop:712 length:459 start_codon:yes stop_codon:yes gene_type:complete
MPIVGFNFDKLLVDKKSTLKAPIKVDTGMKIMDVKKEEIEVVGKKEYIIKFDYQFNVNYNKNQAEVIIAGHLLLAEDQKTINEIYDKWQKDKKMEPKVTQAVMNNVLMRCNIKALLLTQEVNLPPHIRLPLVQPQAPKKAPKKKSKVDSYIG